MNKLTTLKEGQVFHGYQQYFEILSVEGDRVTIYEDAGDCHRVEEGSMADICKMLDAALDPDATDEYYTVDHPEITTLELFPGDWEYKED